MKGDRPLPSQGRQAPPTMGPWMAGALVVGNMIGSGVFLLPASLAPLGWNAVAGWLVTIAGSMALALVLARLARAMPGEGPAAYVARALGPAPAFLMGWTYWISTWVTNATIAVAAVACLASLFPALRTPGTGALAAVALLWLFTAINTAGVRTAGGIQLVTTVIKIVPLVAVIVIAIVALASGSPAPLPPVAGAVTLGGVTTAASLTLWAMLGFESATIPAERIADPARTIPRATVGGTAATGVIYLFACSAVTLLLPSVAGSLAPFADFVEHFLGRAAGQGIAVFAAIAALGALNGWLLLQGEVPLALARAGTLPAWFARTNARGAPVRALVVSSILATVLVASNYSRSLGGLFVFMALLATVNTLFLYALCAVAAIRLGQPRGLAVAGCVYAAWTFWGAGLEASLWGLVSLASGVPVYLWMRLSGPPPEHPPHHAPVA